MEDRIDSGRCAGDVLAAGDLIFSGVAGCENCVADFAILAKILALDAVNRSDDLCRGIGAPGTGTIVSQASSTWPRKPATVRAPSVASLLRAPMMPPRNPRSLP